jgi:hypothetical protein
MNGAPIVIGIRPEHLAMTEDENNPAPGLYAYN